MIRKSGLGLLLALSLAAILGTGCRQHWEFTIKGSDGEVFLIDNQVWESYSRFADEDDILLEQILYELGFRVIDQVEIVGQDGASIRYDWLDIAQTAWLRNDGVILIDQSRISPAVITVDSSSWLARVEGQISDIAPTAAAALGIQPPGLATGKVLTTKLADHVLLLFLDGFGYMRYQEALAGGLIPVLGALEPPLIGFTTYPPITSVSTASLLTGTEPMVHGVEIRSIRKTDQPTLFEAAAAAGLQVAAVEGESLAFNLKGVALQLSGDRDGNGGTDDNVLANVLAVLDEGMPDLLFVHFHGIDDLGHDVGPGAVLEQVKIKEVDRAEQPL